MLKATAFAIFFMKNSYGASIPLDFTQQQPFETIEICEQAKALVIEALDDWPHGATCLPIRFEVVK